MTPAGERTCGLRRGHALTILVLLAAFHVCASAWWMHANGFFCAERPPTFDAAHFRLDADTIVTAMRSDGAAGFFRAVAAHDRPHPPLLPALAALMARADGGIDVGSLWRVEMVFLVLAVFGSYRLARNFGSRRLALAAAAAMSSVPVFVGSARIFFPKFPLAVTVLWTLDAVLRSEGFTRRTWSLVAGAWAGVATMTMMLAPVYVGGSIVTAAILGIRRTRQAAGGGERGGPERAATTAAVGINLALAGLMALAVAAPWYGPHMAGVLRYAADVTGADGQSTFSKGRSLLSIVRWWYYPRQVINNGVGFFPALFFFASCGLLAARALRGAGAAVAGPSAWQRPGLVLTVGALTSFLIVVPGQTHGDSEYVMNLPPLMALCTVCAIAGVRHRPTRLALACGFTLAVMFSFALIHRAMGTDEAAWRIGGLHQCVEVLGDLDRYASEPGRLIGAVAAPQGEHWPFVELLEQMSEERTRDQVAFGEVTGTIHPYLNGGNFAYVARRLGIPFQSVLLGGFLAPTDPDIDRFIADAEFIAVDPGVFPRAMDSPLPKRIALRAAAAGLVVRAISDFRIGSLSDVRVFQFARAGVRPHVLPKAVLDEPEVHRCDVLFANGWHLIAWKEVPRAADRFAVELFFESGAGGTARDEVYVQAYTKPGSTAKFVATTRVLPRTALRAMSRPGASVVCVTSEPLPRHDAGVVTCLIVGAQVDGGGARAEDHILVTATDQPAWGTYAVRLQ